MKHYEDARTALEGVLERGGGVFASARRQAVRRTKAADLVLHKHLYNTVLIGMAFGAALGYLVARRCDHRAE